MTKILNLRESQRPLCQSLYIIWFLPKLIRFPCYKFDGIWNYLFAKDLQKLWSFVIIPLPFELKLKNFEWMPLFYTCDIKYIFIIYTVYVCVCVCYPGP